MRPLGPIGPTGPFARSHFLKFVTAFLLLILCISSRADAPLRIASFSTVLTEIAQSVGGDRVAVNALIQPGADPHSYQPSASDLATLGDSDLVLAPGTHMGGFFENLGETTAGRVPVLQMGDLLKSEKKGGDDPHWWHSIALTRKAVILLRRELEKLRPADAPYFQERAAAYLAGLDDLEAWVKRKVAELPRDRRILVTAHDAFQAYARDYGFTNHSIEGVHTHGEPSNRHVAELVDLIRRDKIKAVFVESAINPKVTTEITRETGARLGGTLYADGPGEGDASTYSGMTRHNISTIVDALK